MRISANRRSKRESDKVPFDWPFPPAERATSFEVLAIFAGIPLGAPRATTVQQVRFERSFDITDVSELAQVAGLLGSLNDLWKSQHYSTSGLLDTWHLCPAGRQLIFTTLSGANRALPLRGLMASFIKDVEEIRQRAVEKIEDGPVTATYRGDKDKAISILNEALATEIVCVLRYMHHYFMATGVHGRAVADEFKEHADAEREHADEIAERIQQLGGKPDFNPASLLQRSVSQYVEGETLSDMIREDLIAERMVIEVYQEMIRFFGNNDPTTRRLIEHILSEEEEHAADLSDLLYVVNPHTGETEGRDPGTDPLSIERSRQGRGGSKSSTSGEGQDFAGEDSEVQTRINASGERHPSPREDVKGHDREYDGVQDIAQSRSQEKAGRNNPSRLDAGTSSKRGATSVPGTSGRPMNRRKDIAEEDVDEVAKTPNRGGMAGGTRSPKVLQKNRKNKRVA